MLTVSHTLAPLTHPTHSPPSLTPSSPFLQYTQSSGVEPGAWYACLPLHVVYQYDPIPGPWQEMVGGGPAAAAGGGQEVSVEE